MKFVNEIRIMIEQTLVDAHDIILDIGDFFYQVYVELMSFVKSEFSLMLIIYFLVLVLVLLR